MHSLAHPGDKTELMRRLARIRPDSPARWGRMTAPQMVHHLTDSARMALAELQVRPVVAGIRGVLIKRLALYVPLRWPAGRIQTVPEFDHLINPVVCGDFADEVADLTQLTERMAASATLCPIHPFFGAMSRRDWMRWAYLHTDHHLRQFGA